MDIMDHGWDDNDDYGELNRLVVKFTLLTLTLRPKNQFGVHFVDIDLEALR